MKKSLFLAAFSAVVANAFAQQEICGSMTLLRQRLATDAEAGEQFSRFIELSEQAEINHALHGNASTRALSDTIYIPVVFHVIHNGDALGANENISDAQILSQIEVFNESFALTNENAAYIPDEFKALAAKMKIRFCMAQFTATGAPTTGITRHNLGVASWNQDSIESIAKPATVWDRNKYLNIWTFNFGGDLQSGGTLAYAQFPPPFGGSANTDGLAVRYNCVGRTGTLMSSYGLGNTLVHEAGHWLGLFHIWGDDNGACNGSDYVDDTPNQGDMNFGCPTYPHASCTPSDMFMNHMDYSNDVCRSMFTKGQEDRMMGVLNGTLNPFSRVALKTGGLARCFYNMDATIAEVLQPDSVICSSSFSPILFVKNIGQTDIHSLTISYGIDGNYASYAWNGSLVALGNMYLTLPSVSGFDDGNHTFRAFITQVNGDSDNNTANDTVVRAFSSTDQSMAITVPYTQDFESGAFPPDGWSILNPNNDIVKWSESSTAGGYDRSSYSIWINNRAYTSNPARRKDAFQSPQLDFTPVQEPHLSFQYAYMNRGTNNDSLAVYYSLNCGATWKEVYRKGGVSMRTVRDSSRFNLNPFVPQEGEWDSVSIAIPVLGGQNNVLFKFENTTGWGNALYIDNINLYEGRIETGISQVNTEKVEVLMFPNPASQSVTVKLPENHPFSEIQIFDALGRVVRMQKIIDPISLLNVNGLSTGVYTVTMLSKSFAQTEKLVIVK